MKKPWMISLIVAAAGLLLLLPPLYASFDLSRLFVVRYEDDAITLFDLVPLGALIAWLGLVSLPFTLYASKAKKKKWVWAVISISDLILAALLAVVAFYTYLMLTPRAAFKFYNTEDKPILISYTFDFFGQGAPHEVYYQKSDFVYEEVDLSGLAPEGYVEPRWTYLIREEKGYVDFRDNEDYQTEHICYWDDFYK